MRILVTGCAGYIGVELVNLLLSEGHQVIGYDSLLLGGNQLLPFFRNANFSFIRGDVREDEKIKTALKDADAIVHLAAIVGYPACAQDPILATQVNVEGTRSILKHASKEQIILFGSTGSNYGAIDGICTEETKLNPLTVYAETKTQAEREICESGLNFVAFRFATAFGISGRIRLDLLINDFTHKLWRDGYLVVYEHKFMRTFIHVRDIARAFIHAFRHFDQMKNECYNVGNEKLNFTKGAVAQKIADQTNGLLHFAEIGSDGDKRDYLVDYSKIRNTGFTLNHTIEEGVSELISVFKVLDNKSPYINANNH